MRPDDDWLCLYCNGERDPSGRRCERASPFCSSGCVESYQLRIGTGTIQRRVCFSRDGGVCASCGLDCHALYLRLRPLPAERRREILDEAFRGDGGGKGLRKGSRLTQVRYDGIVARCHPGDLWQADHIRAVMHGGGQATSAAQYQTLCTPCHLEKTRRERGGN